MILLAVPGPLHFGASLIGFGAVTPRPGSARHNPCARKTQRTTDRSRTLCEPLGTANIGPQSPRQPCSRQRLRSSARHSRAWWGDCGQEEDPQKKEPVVPFCSVEEWRGS